jgi:hypothetical protein
MYRYSIYLVNVYHDNLTGVKMPEFTATMKVVFEVTINAEDRSQAESCFDNIYLDASIETNENSPVEVLSDNTDLIENNWQIND